MRYVKTDPEGCVLEVGTYRGVLPDGAIVLETSLSSGQLAKCIIVVDEFAGPLEEGSERQKVISVVARPLLNPPEITNTLCSFIDAPEGTQIEVIDVLGDEMMGVVDIDPETKGAQFRLPETGLYHLEVRPPKPYMSAQFVVEISDE